MATKDIMMLEGIAIDIIDGRGNSKLEQLWSMILFGDYMAYYMAIAYDTDPTPIPAIEALKQEMRK
jgi:glucose/mannose-6-phosphate isomerase